MGQETEETILRIDNMRAAREADRQARMAGLPPDPNAVAMQKHAATIEAVREHTEAVWGPVHHGGPVAPVAPARPDWDATIWFEIDRSNIGLPLTYLMERIVAAVGEDLARRALDYATPEQHPGQR